MTRYKSRAGLKVIESKFPHHIDMLVPEGGFGSRLNAMHDWHDARGISAVHAVKAGAKMGATTFDGALLIRASLKRSRMNSANCAQHERSVWCEVSAIAEGAVTVRATLPCGVGCFSSFCSNALNGPTRPCSSACAICWGVVSALDRSLE